MNTKELDAIKKNAITRILEKYDFKLEAKHGDKRDNFRAEYSAESATEHDYSEEALEKKRQKYAERKVKEAKREEVRKLLNQAIQSNFGLKDNELLLQRFLYKEDGLAETQKKEIEDFLVMIASLRYEENRIIYYDKIETDRTSWNKNFFRDLKKSSLNMDFTNLCNYVSENSVEKIPINSEILELSLKTKKDLLKSYYENRISPLEMADDIVSIIEMAFRYYLLPNASSKAVLELYSEIALIETHIFKFFELSYFRESKKGEKISRFLKKMWEKLSKIPSIEIPKLAGYKTGYNIFQEYEWRLMCQTTREENNIRVFIYELLKESPVMGPAEISDDTYLEKEEKIKQLLKWYVEHNYSTYVLNTEEDFKMLHYEIYNDKSIKYKGVSAEVVANKILRNEYYKGYQLDEEVLFLQYKIRKAFLESKGIDSKEYFNIKYDCCKISQIVWNLFQENECNPTVLLDLYRMIMVDWIKSKPEC